ncbi:MAG TPA: cyclase family protein [Candidatus Limnocylindrales bacterium]|nr:cyclase family protein [Candidatus Limnocylindrales bacterium]
MTMLGALAGLTPAAVRAAAALVTDGIVIDLSIPLDGDILPRGDPEFHRPFDRTDVMTPEQWSERVDSGVDAFHLDAVSGSIHQGTHIDGLVHVVNDGRVYDGHEAATARTDRGWTFAGIETVPPIVTRGVLIDLLHARDGRPLTGSEEVTVADVDAALAASREAVRPGDAVLLRTGKMRELSTARETFLDAQPGIGVDAAIHLADAGMAVFGSDTGGTEPQPVVDWTRTVHVELLTRRGIHLVEWMDLDPLATTLAEHGRTDFLFIAVPLRIRGATGSWVRPIALI